MQNDKQKYVPPALRGAGLENVSSFNNDGGGGDRGGYGGGGRDGGYTQSNQRWGEDGGNDRGGGDRRGYGGGDRGGFSGGGSYGRGDRGGYGGGDRGGYGGGGERGSSGDRGRSSGGYGGGRSSNGYSFGAKVNELGYHGDMRPNPRIEQELFHTEESQTAGINFDKYDDIPVEVSKGCPEPYTEFTVDTIGPQLLKNLVLTKYFKPTPVQKYSIPIGLAGGDMMACAQTGSGKTAGFLFPLIAIMLKTGALPEPESRNGSRRGSFISALVLAPTRELAIQIYDEANKFCYCTGIRPVCVYGGANIQQQQQQLDLGADVLVATPGRLVDLIDRGRIKLDIVKFLILDEADRMLDMGFEPQIRRIVQESGMSTDRQTFMFSATFPHEIQKLAGDFMRNYIFVAVGRVGAANKDVTQRVEWVEQNEKIDFTVDFLTRVPEGLVLIFVETKRGADYLEDILTRNNFPASSIHGDKSQKEREDALRMFKTGRTPILVATDVAARGLDIPNVTQVINFDLPSNIDDYVHRIGRTGRVGNTGNALSLINDKNRNIVKDLIELLHENDQELPNWLERIAGSVNFNFRGGRGGGRGGGGRGGSQQRFGARDYRKDQPQQGQQLSGQSGTTAIGSGGGGFNSSRPSGGGVSNGGNRFASNDSNGGRSHASGGSGVPMPPSYSNNMGGPRPPDSWGRDNSAW